MRIIDSDELLKGRTDHEMISTHLIYNAPTVDVLDKIRAEIEACREDEEPHLCDHRHYRNEGIDKALEVIDKYR